MKSRLTGTSPCVQTVFGRGDKIKSMSERHLKLQNYMYRKVDLTECSDLPYQKLHLNQEKQVA